MKPGSSLPRVILFFFASISILQPSILHGRGGDLLLKGPFGGLGPEGIAHDPTDNTFWVTSALDPVIRHFDDQLNSLGSIPTPFLGNDTETGIAYYPTNDSLLIVNPNTFELLAKIRVKTSDWTNGRMSWWVCVSNMRTSVS